MNTFSVYREKERQASAAAGSDPVGITAASEGIRYQGRAEMAILNESLVCWAFQELKPHLALTHVEQPVLYYPGPLPVHHEVRWGVHF